MKKIALTLALSLVPLAGASAKYKEQTVSGGGSIAGTVLFSGDVPKVDMVAIAKDNEVCGDGNIAPNPITVGSNGALQNVVVFLDKVKAGKPWPKNDYAVNQLKCTFEPYLQVVPKGVELTIKNSDPVLHNVHPFEHIKKSRRTMFNLAQPKLGQVNKKVIKTRRGQVVELACDAHAWMSGWLYVLEHPYFAVVGEDGSFKIENVPPGSYTLKAWHPVLQFQEQKIEVKADGSATASFKFAASN